MINKWSAKNHLFDYALVFLLVVMSAHASFLGSTLFRFPLLLFAFLLLKQRKKIFLLENFNFVLLFWSCWLIILSAYFWMIYDHFIFDNLLTYLSFTTLILSSVCAAVALNNFLNTYIKVIYHLAIISLFFFLIQLVNFGLLISILKSFDGLNLLFKESMVRPSIVIFSYPLDAGFLCENPGFASEPGMFSVYLILALLLHVTYNNFKIDKVVIVLSIALLTTLSTAGYMGLIVVLVYSWYNVGKIENRIFFTIILIPIIALIINQEFIYTKIESSLKRETARYERSYRERITPGRFGSLLLDLNDFKKNPVVGYGVHIDTTYINYGRIEQQRTNGLSRYLVKFGLVAFLFMIYNFYKTFNALCRAKSVEGPIFIILGVFTVAFSQVFLATPLFFVLQFYHFKFRKNSLSQAYNRRVMVHRALEFAPKAIPPKNYCIHNSNFP